jgi:hypothetical protein
MPARTTLPARARSGLAALIALGVLGIPLVAQSAAGAAATDLPSAMTIAERMDRRPFVFMLDPRDEGPQTVVRGGHCNLQLGELGCVRMVSTKDASVILFGTAAQARNYVGGSDDRAKAFGRMVLSFGSPLRVVEERQGAYRKALRAFRQHHHAARNDVDRAVRNLTRKGLLMRDPQIEDVRGERLGLASKIPGAVDMVATNQADVIIFSTRAAAKEYVGNADDVAYRRGRVVLSFGSPPRVVPSGQVEYERVLRRVLD